ncbi:hypothetical protein Bca101_065314 [Brassica carinata]
MSTETLVLPELNNLQNPRRNQIYSSPLLLHVGEFHRSIEISSDTAKLPVTRGITKNPSRSIHKSETLNVRVHRYILSRRRKTVGVFTPQLDPTTAKRKNNRAIPDGDWSELRQGQKTEETKKRSGVDDLLEERGAPAMARMLTRRPTRRPLAEPEGSAKPQKFEQNQPNSK